MTLPWGHPDNLPPLRSPDFCAVSLVFKDGTARCERIGFGNNEPARYSLEGARIRVFLYKQTNGKMVNLAKPNCILRVYLK
jgi:hypothetical protein